MKTEEELIWESYTNSQKTMSLNDVYGDLYDIPESEALYHAVDPEKGDIQLPVLTLSVEDLKKLTTYTRDMTVFDAYQEYADKEQKDIVKQYLKDKSYKSEPIIINISTVIDGYHRLIAAILDNSRLTALDISDLDE